MEQSTSSMWINSTDFAAAPQPRDLYEFFGIPPSPQDALDGNIRTKRKHWRMKNAKARNPEAAQFAEAVLQAIGEAEDALKRGSSVDVEGTAAPSPQTRVTTLDDLWHRIEMLLFRGRYAESLESLANGKNEWGDDPRFRDLRAMTVLDVLQNAPTMPLLPGAVDEAIADARFALNNLGAREPQYLTLIELLDAVGRAAEAEQVMTQALERLGSTSRELQLRRLQILCRQPAWDEILRFAIRLVEQFTDDRAVRSQVVQELTAAAIRHLLPISSDAAAVSYRRVITVAAWAANGVPEAEDFVRPHRMWSTNTTQKIFAGNWQWRAFFGLISGFILLPVINALFSKPAWKVLMAGPSPAVSLKQRKVNSANRAYFMVTRNPYIDAVHEKIKLPWQSQPGQWPLIEPVFDF